MKIVSWGFLALILSCTPTQKTLSQKKAKPETYAETITQEELKEHLYTYASDEFEGRETGTPGQKKAIEYLKSHYESLGIPAAKSDGDYFQKVPLQKSSVPSGSMTINNTSFAVGEAVISFTPAEGKYNQIVYVGYGIDEGTYSDYEQVDVKDKMVLIKAGEPMNEDGTYALSGTSEPSVWSNMSEAIGKKGELAFDKGAKGVLYYDSGNYPRYSNYYSFIKNSSNPRMTLQAEANTALLMVLDAEPAKLIFPDIDSNHTPKLLDTDVQLALENQGFVDSENVVAMIRGSEKPDEYVVISSHLDHIGVSKDGQINNGADDDGSGSVALLEIAEAFKKAKNRGYGPKRSIIFLHVTGEEKGLLGSKYYTDYEPIKPLEQTVANLNIDMIGRTDPKREGNRNYIYLIGSDKLSTELHNLSEEINEKYMQIELDYKYNDDNDPNRFYYRSDHYNFAKNNIPIIFYFNGTHEDYHKPGDTPDKINYDLLENRTRLVFHTAWEVANRENRVIVDKPVE
ncbi:M28 family peptidase [Flagellimonas sp.]|uniref:M28 family peptidase n=1 Tax=Flagellimonas sp. TaxID=2058762 RepID=UPI003F4A4F6C